MNTTISNQQCTISAKQKNKQSEFILVTKDKEEMLRKESIIHVLTIQTYNHKYPQTTTSQMTIRKTKKLIIQENYNFANYYDTTNKTHKNVIFRSNKAFSISNNIKIAEIQKSTSLSEYISTKI